MSPVHAPAVRSIHDNFNVRARATRANLVQYGSTAAALRPARQSGRGGGLPGIVSKLDCERRSAGAKNLRDVRTEGCGGDRPARDIRTSRRLQSGGAQGVHTRISPEVSDRARSTESDESHSAHHGTLQDAGYAEPRADRPARTGAQARIRRGR